MLLFNKHGYRETSMEDIAAEVGLPASGIYRYFAGKADMLAASFRRAADRVSDDLANVVAAEPDPDQAIMRLISSYVARSFDDPELAYVYYTERVNLPAGDQVILRSIQRSTVESWVRLLIGVRPELTAGQARFAVHAAFALVVDLGRLVQYDNTEESRAYVRRMMEVTLLGQHSAAISARLVPVGATNRAEITPAADLS
jgi:AcrR family transcriptional regulator